MFDQDEPGRQAAEEAAAVLPICKVKLAVLPHKDANEVLVKDGPGALVSAFWNAKPWRPDGIVSGEDFTVDALMEATEPGDKPVRSTRSSMLAGSKPRASNSIS